MKNALIIYSAPAFLLNVPMSWEIFLNIKSQVKFKHYFHTHTPQPDFQIGHLTMTCSRMIWRRKGAKGLKARSLPSNSTA